MSGKRILITGAASGICAATMDELGSLGAQVIGLDLNAHGDQLILCDVRDQKSVDAAVLEGIERLGGIDVLINGAGIAPPQSAGLPPDEKAIAAIDINLVGPWRVTSAALEELRKSCGRVVNIASGMAFVSMPFAPAYAMSKHGVVAYSNSLRIEHGDAITVTTVYPGYIKTPIQRDSEAFGLTLEGSSPEEKIEDAVNALVKASLDRKPSRDIVSNRTGVFTSTFSRYAPRGLVDRVILSGFRKMKGRERINGAPQVVNDFAQRLQDRR
ncbi:MAG: SDR family NAD(P)-dependent oxidoreductase [Solirubrobacterales bacterium]